MANRSHLGFHLWICSLLLLSIHAHSFYLPGVAPQDFFKGDILKVKVNKLASTKTQLPYSYYSVPYCRPDKIVDSAENLGEVLRGDRIENSPYEFQMRVPQMCNVVCRIVLDEKSAKEFKEKIDDEYRVNMILDNLPLVVPMTRLEKDSPVIYQHGFFVGRKVLYAGTKEEKYFINNHLTFTVKYHKDPQTDSARIVGFEVNAFSVQHQYDGKWTDKTRLTTCDAHAKRLVTSSDPPQEVENKKEIIFTYDVDFQICFAAKETELLQWKGDILAVGVTEKDMTKDSNSKFQNLTLEKLDSKLGGLLSEVSIEEDFTGKTGHLTVNRVAGLGFKRVGLFGLGKSLTGPSTSNYYIFGESVAAVAKASQANNVAIALVSSEGLNLELKLATASAIAKGTMLGTYEDKRFKSESKKPSLKSVDIFGLGAGPMLEKKLKHTEYICSGVILGKELVNAPANVLTPEVLAEESEKIAAAYSDVLTARILDEEQCKELKMGSYLAVAAASSNPPKFIHLCYKPTSGPIKTKLALVGKGLTFDSGGYNIKIGPVCSIELMKRDMGGSAAVLGAATALGQIKPLGVEVHFIVAACENMISGTGMRPGDIVTASNGKTIEVNNTDAEGRLTLADALVYACNQGVDKIVDLATLTGACKVALGPSIAGIFTPSDELCNEVVAASEAAGEKLWRLPMEESYWESMKSRVADMVNTGSPQGGAITAALFLKQFVDEKVDWLHIDMAGPVWDNKKKEASGFGIHTLVEWVLSTSAS